MSNPAKMLRSQLRNIIQEILPDLIKEAVKSELHEQLRKEVQVRLDNVTKNVKDTLDMVDQRSKDIQSYLVHQTTQAPAAVGVDALAKTE